MSTCILIVSESPDVGEIIETRVKKSGNLGYVAHCDTVTANRLLQHVFVDLLILDMAETDEGYADLVELVRRKNPNAQVILMTERLVPMPIELRAENCFHVARFNFGCLKEVLHALTS